MKTRAKPRVFLMGMACYCAACRDSDVVKTGGLSYLMAINAEKDKQMSVKELRQKKGWSQEHLAQASGLSLRTIQRIESGKRAGLETLNGLAAVFDIDLNLIRQEPKMTTQTSTKPAVKPEKNPAKEYMDNINSLKIMFWAYLIFMPLLYALNIWTEPEFLWIWIVAAGWGAGFPLYAIIIKTVFGVFDLKMTAEEADRHFNSQR